MTPLHEAARSGHLEVVGVLLDRGAAVDATEVRVGWWGLQVESGWREALAGAGGLWI